MAWIFKYTLTRYCIIGPTNVLARHRARVFEDVCAIEVYCVVYYQRSLVVGRLFVTRWMKVTEAVLVAACSAIILVVLIYSVPDCKPVRGFHQQSTGANTTGRDVGSQRGNGSLASDVKYDEHSYRADPYGEHRHGFTIKVIRRSCLFLV